MYAYEIRGGKHIWFDLRSEALKRAFLDELNPHKTSLQSNRDSLQKAIDDVKVGKF